ncbi:HAD family hydrolase [Ruminiclostridium josui]|uniref:HAD family hydrolase n=1 Tax=Ruminiclostridium josui TaxID=1499 RepID=UPI0004655F54|nr:HAD family phosphatase [Ruminiclostridium josui]
MKNIRLIACDIDGVLLEDTFSPVLRNLALKFGHEYTRELERNVFSRKRADAGKYMMEVFNIDDGKYLYDSFFGERERYLKEHDSGLIEGVPEFLEFLSSLDVQLVCYGGLSEDLILDDFKKYLNYFDRYVCTNDFRPGIKEITKDIYGLDYNQVLFIDDVNTFAEAAKADNVPFIGIPSKFPWGFQRQDMIRTGLKYILNSVKEIDLDLLQRIDEEISDGTLWKSQGDLKGEKG